MAAYLEQIADAALAELVVQLAAEGYASATAARKYAPQIDLDQLGTLHAYVIPVGTSRKRTARKMREFRHRVGIVLVKLCPTEAEQSALVNLADDLADYFEGRQLSAYTAATCADTATSAAIMPDELQQKGVFEFRANLTFLEHRSVS